jgi:hypothetical protein
MLAFTTEDGQRQLERLAGEDMRAAVEHGRQRLEDDPLNADDGVLAYDGRITVAGGKLDAVLLEMRSYMFPWAKAVISVPYTSRSSGRFRVHKPKLVEWERCEDFDLDARSRRSSAESPPTRRGPGCGMRPWTRASETGRTSLYSRRPMRMRVYRVSVSCPREPGAQ